MKKILMMLVLMTSLMSNTWASSSQVLEAETDSISWVVADSIKKADMDYLAAAIAEAIEETQPAINVNNKDTKLRMAKVVFQDTLVPIFVAGIMPLGIVVCVLLYLYYQKKDRNRVILSAIEHGQDISQFLAAEQSQHLSTNDEILKKGIKNIAVGAALIILLYIIAKEIAAVGCFPLFMGIGQIVIAKTTGNKVVENSDTTNAEV